MENLVAGRPIVFVWGVTVAIYGLDRTAGMAMQFPASCVESAARLDAQEQLCVADGSRMDRVSAMKCSRDRHLAQTLHPGRNHWKVVAYACYASDKRASPWKGTSPARCSRCQRRNAGRGRARGASALDATYAFCPPSPDLVSSAGTNSLIRRRSSPAFAVPTGSAERKHPCEGCCGCAASRASTTNPASDQGD